jgi:hypothetical protein
MSKAYAYKDANATPYDEGARLVNEYDIIDGQVLDSRNGMVRIKYNWYSGPTEGWFKISELEFKDNNVPKGFDTGGYTGEWDSSGRLAMLHQKEIVLNAHDTENFLSAINIVRDIASMIDLRAAA